MHILTLSHVWQKLFIIYTPEFWNKNVLKFFTKVTTSLFEGFKQKEIFFNVTLIINTFLSISIKKNHTNHIRQVCIGKDRLISVKYWLNFTEVEN